MFLGNATSSAASGLDSIERQLAVLSQNVANASTPNYVVESVPLTSLDSAAGPAGVRPGQPQRQIDLTLQANLFASVGKEAGSNVAQSALSAIDQASGTPGSGQDLPSLLGSLRNSFSTLTTDPSSGSQQLDVLDKAAAVANGIHSLGDSIVQGRQAAQGALTSDVTAVNDALKSFGTLSTQIIAAKAAGQSTAGLEDQRDGQMQGLAQMIGAKFVPQSSGDIVVIAGNSVVPTRSTSGPFSLGPVNFSAGTPAASVPPLLLDGSPTAGLGGSVGANLTLRDTTLPAMQAGLDGFAQSLAAGFQGQGLPLFTDGAGAVPAAGSIGFSGTIQVSVAVETKPTMLRDGTGAPGLAGNTTLIGNVLNNVFSSDATGVPAQASSLITGYAGMSSQASAQATTNTALRTGLSNRLSSVTGVSVDSEMAHMVQLKAAYAANAKVITATQNMWTQLLQAV